MIADDIQRLIGRLSEKDLKSMLDEISGVLKKACEKFSEDEKRALFCRDIDLFLNVLEKKGNYVDREYLKIYRGYKGKCMN